MVILFGGFLARTEDMLAWQASASEQRRDATFGVYPWPSGVPADTPLQHWSRGNEIAALLKRNATQSPHILVGHSSGCALANSVAYCLLDLSVDFFLVALDGFRPGRLLIERAQTSCWSATCDGIKSRNYGALESAPQFHVYEARDARTEWALHFSLVNSNSTDATVHAISDGYKNCVANLCWMPSWLA